MKRVDDVLDEKLDFVLMDTEKTEVAVLDGMRKILERSPSIVVLLEWEYLENPQRDEGKTRLLMRWLKEKGFKWYRYSRNTDPCKLGTIS